MEKEYGFGSRLKRIRKQAHLSQQEVANRIGVARITVTRWESGVSPYPYHREKLCELFQKEEEELFPTNGDF